MITAKKIAYVLVNALIFITLAGCQTPTLYVIHEVIILKSSSHKPIRSQPLYATLNSAENCKLTCFSFKSQGSRYALLDKNQGETIYVHGFTQVIGKQDKEGVCRPHDYGNKDDISQIPVFNELCRLTVASCHQDCWAGGNP